MKNCSSKSCKKSCFKWILGIVIILAIGTGVAYAMGKQLPVEHSITRSASYKAAPEAVWDAVTNIDKMAEWDPNIQKTEWLPDQNGHKAWRATTKHGVMEFEITENTFPRHVSKIIGPADLPFGGEWVFDLATTPTGGTNLTLTENGEMHSAFCRFIAHYVMGYDWMLKSYLNQIALKFGETVEVK